MQSLNTEIGKYLNFNDFCTCTNTYKKYASQIDPFPSNSGSITAIKNLCEHIIDPIIDYFGEENFQLTYGFCSKDLKRYLEKKDPATNQKNGRIDPSTDQHMALETNRNGQYYCKRPGASCDFLITNVPSNQVVDWILHAHLKFDSLFYYGETRPIHISYGLEHKRAVWTFSNKGMPTKKGIENWVKLALNI
ncbi:hypothetical protein NIES4071_107820 (plasmid) [Calothrix sp. NIES-4071]|nr:hypothetical protein NIES4071_107820 [Calothrix sp. NIES-4071]BAZ64822.1 hypothetical protein NIES4105_105550 [Calothrix sp. NIES-4105]